MKYPLATSIALSVCALLVVNPAPMWAMQPAPVPSFQVATPNGVSVSSGDVDWSGQKVLIYLRPNCGSCEALLHLLKKDDPGTMVSNIIVIVGGPSAQATQEVDHYPDLANASWYMDTYQEASQALVLQGMPVVIGVRDGVMAWRMNGVMADQHSHQRLLQTWLAGAN